VNLTVPLNVRLKSYKYMSIGSKQVIPDRPINLALWSHVILAHRDTIHNEITIAPIGSMYHADVIFAATTVR
jgi:hypothetical protein